MEIIAHRRNTTKELQATPIKYGIEVDIRSQGEVLVIHHDPYVTGELFESWLQHYRHGTLILNVKEEGLEERLITLMLENGIQNYFFLDQSFPFLVKYALLGEHRCAVRVSEFESPETPLSLAGKIDWVWVDCFNRFPLTAADAQRLRAARFRLCLVSPELQGHDPEREIPKLVEMLRAEGIIFDAVCTKRADIWEQYLA